MDKINLQEFEKQRLKAVTHAVLDSIAENVPGLLAKDRDLFKARLLADSVEKIDAMKPAALALYLADKRARTRAAIDAVLASYSSLENQRKRSESLEQRTERLFVSICAENNSGVAL